MNVILGTRYKYDIQKSNNPGSERLEELLFLGSEITKPDDFWPRLLLNPEIPMIYVVPRWMVFSVWRRRSLSKRGIIAQTTSDTVIGHVVVVAVLTFFFSKHECIV